MTPPGKTLKQMGMNYADRNPTPKLTLQEQELENKMYSNKKAYDKIWEDIISVTNKLRFCKDTEEKKILNEQFRVLSNKYSFSNGLDSVISH